MIQTMRTLICAVDFFPSLSIGLKIGSVFSDEITVFSLRINYSRDWFELSDF